MPGVDVFGLRRSESAIGCVIATATVKVEVDSIGHLL